MRREPPLHALTVALGDRRYRVERPFGAWPANCGKVSDVAVGPDGTVYVMLRHDPLVDPDDPRIVALSPGGVFLRAFAEREIADSHRLLALADGRLLAVDRDMHETAILSDHGARLGGLGARGRPGAPLDHPTDVARHPSGDFYVTCGYAGWTVQRFDAAGRHLGGWGRPGDGPGAFADPHGVWCLSDGRVVVVDRGNHRLQVFDAEGAWLAEWRGFRRPVAIWGDAADELYVTDETPSLSRLAPDGTLIGRARPMLFGAHGICGAPDGAILLAEPSPSRLTRLVPI